MSIATITSVTTMTLADLEAQEKAAERAGKERQKRVGADERTERRRAAKTGFSNLSDPVRSMALTITCTIFVVYCLFSFVYLIINATKTQSDFISTFDPGFGRMFTPLDNIAMMFTYQDGIFGRWFVNTILYVVVGAGGTTLLAITGGYALAKFRFPGRKLCFVIIIGVISVLGIALVVPQLLLFTKVSLTNTPWSMIIPSLVSMFGLYLMWTFPDRAVPDKPFEVTRADGAGELHTPFQISLPLLAPSIVITALSVIIAMWNSYLLLLIVLKDSNWYPLTISLNQWKNQVLTVGGQATQNLVITGSLIATIPLMIAFLCLQKYWQSGLAAGAIKK